jgi:cellulase
MVSTADSTIFCVPQIKVAKMKYSILSVMVALGTRQVASHTIFQELWVNGVDQICFLLQGLLPLANCGFYQSTCARLPLSNSPVTDMTNSAFRCNGRPGIATKCTVAAGQTVTVEMHQQLGDRSCKNETIGGAHYGPVTVYLSKVADGLHRRWLRWMIQDIPRWMVACRNQCTTD